jgi:hypothetical protein
MKKVYADNNVICAIGKHDMRDPGEASPIAIISAMFDAGQLPLYASNVTKEELDPWQGDKKPVVLQLYDLLPKVPRVERQELLGIHVYSDLYTCINSPMIEDHPLWLKLRTFGLKEFDEHHLMVAILAGCDVFLTCDKGDFGPRRSQLAKAFPLIQILWPSEALYRL